MLLAEPYYLFAFNFLAGVILGSVLFRSDFCMAGMLRDLFLFRNYSLFPSLFLLVGSAMLLFFFARNMGFLTLYPPPTYGYPSLTTVFGGLVFGIGMVMAGGCVISTLYKMAGGNLAYGTAFAGIVTGSLLYAEFHPFWESLRTGTVLTKHRLLSEIIPGSEGPLLPGITVIFLVLFRRWKKAGRWTVTAYAEGYLQPWKAALMIAALNTAVYIFSGWPIGVTTAYAKVGAYLESLFLPSHVSRLSYFHQDTVTLSLAGSVVTGGAGPRTDIIFFTELALIAGVLAGSFLTAVVLREFRIYGLPPKRQMLSAFAGGMLLAFGARIAGGCNVKFIMGALPLFALQGGLFAMGAVAGAWVGTRVLTRFVLPKG